MKQQKLPQYQLKKLHYRIFTSQRKWKSFLFQHHIRKKHHKQIATEAAPLGSLIHQGWNRDLDIVSDDAGQFNILLHALCWILAERSIQKSCRKLGLSFWDYLVDRVENRKQTPSLSDLMKSF